MGDQSGKAALRTANAKRTPLGQGPLDPVSLEKPSESAIGKQRNDTDNDDRDCTVLKMVHKDGDTQTIEILKLMQSLFPSIVEVCDVPLSFFAP